MAEDRVDEYRLLTFPAAALLLETARAEGLPAHAPGMTDRPGPLTRADRL